MAFEQAFEAALSTLSEDHPALDGARVVGWTVLVESRLPDGRGAVTKLTMRGQQSWTTQGHLSWALQDEHLRQPVAGL